MKSSQAPQTSSVISYKERYGLTAWIAGFIVFFAAQIVAGLAWKNPQYSWSWNNVSDLGNAHCGMWAENGHAATYVCSPLHPLMNVAFVFQGLCLIVGVVLTGFLWRKTRSSKITRFLLAFAAFGLVIAGLFPADVNENMHVLLGALPLALFGNVGLILTGKAVNKEVFGNMRFLGPILGVIGLICTYLFLSHNYLGLGPGGMERCWAYNFLIWSVVVGVYMLMKTNSGRSKPGILDA